MLPDNPKDQSVKSLGPSSKVRAIIPFGSGETVGSEVTEASGTGETSDAAEEASEGSSTSEEAFWNIHFDQKKYQLLQPVWKHLSQKL